MTTLTDQTPYYACVVCCGELSHPAEDLRVFEGELWCQCCWDDQEGVFKGVEWSVLDPFIPAHEIRIRDLEAKVERLKSAIKLHVSSQHILEDRAEAAEAQLAEAHTLVGQLRLGAVDFCKEHSVMRKPDVEWPCGMCEQRRAKAAEAKLREVKDVEIECIRMRAYVIADKLKAILDRPGGTMKASEKWWQGELLHHATGTVTVEQAEQLCEAAWNASAERYLALADELEGTVPNRGSDYLSGRVDERLDIAKRLREIAEGRE